MKIEEDDLLLQVDTDFVIAHHEITGFCFSDIRDYGIHAIPLKNELNGNADAAFQNLPVDTICFVRGKNRLSSFAYQLHQAISNEVQVGTDENGTKVYRLEYRFERKGRTSERLHGFVSAPKLLELCKALYANRVAKV